MKCRFCSDQECPKDTLSRQSKLDLYQCPKCEVYYRTLRDQEGALVCVSWRVRVGDKEFFIKCYDGCTGNAPEFVISHYAVSGEGVQQWQEVKRFNFVPDTWTPFNSAHKLKLYLPFL